MPDTTSPHSPQSPLTAPGLLDVEALGRTLLLIPHPDDEVIGCGGLLIALADAAQPACVVLVSDGSGAGELPQGTAEIRQHEFRQALEILYPGCDQQQWRLPDGGLDREAGLTGRVVEAALGFRADTLVAPWPRDMHPDHAALGAAAQRAVAGLPALRSLLFYETWSPLEANRVLEVTDSWPRKTQALACHATALQAQNYDRSMDGLACHRALLLPGIAAGEAVRRAEAWHLQEIDRGRVNASARFVTRPACQADADAIIALFREVFGASVDRAWWDWKYRHPDWIGTVALTDEQVLAGFYGVVPRTAYWQGRALPVCQMVDSMVAGHSRVASRSSGAFQEMCLRFLTPNVGDDKPFALAFGFPNERAMRAGEHMAVYQRGEGTFLWTRPAQPWQRQPGPFRPWQRLVWRSHILRVDSAEDLRWVDPLFAAMRGALADTLLLERGAQAWDWRFRRHPQAQYRFLQLRRLGRVVAGGVLRQRDEQGALELVDAVFEDHRAFHGLVKAAEHQAWTAGLPRILVWGTERLMAALPAGETVREGSVAWPDPQFNASLVPQVRGHFWAMGGDTDFR